METSFDLVVIGSGPGGYVGAIRAAQLGLKTAIVEKDKTLGGTCLNVGCIPSKALLESSEHYAAALHDLSGHGVKLKGVDLDLPTMLSRKDKIVKDLTGGISFLMKKNKIEVFPGLGKVKGPGQVEVQLSSGQSTTLSAKNIMLATGSIPVSLPFLKVDEKQIVTSTGALSLPEVPKHLVIIGAGVIGLELGSVWMRLGAKVTAIEFADRIGGALDSQIATQFQRILSKQGMNFLLKTKVTGAEADKKGVQVSYESVADGSKGQMDADVVLVSVGRKPYSEGLGLEEVGVQKDQAGRVIINEHFQTSVPGIYAIGDLVRGPMLAHKAEEEGVAVAEFLATGYGHVNYNTVPGVIYTWPEVATVGLTEEQVKEQNIPYNVGSFPFTPNGRARALGMTEGLCKIIAHKESDKILGVHIVGPRASELIHEAIVAMEFGGSSEDLARSFHAHPTLNEVIREAALAVEKRARQM